MRSISEVRAWVGMHSRVVAIGLLGLVAVLIVIAGALAAGIAERAGWVGGLPNESIAFPSAPSASETPPPHPADSPTPMPSPSPTAPGSRPPDPSMAPWSSAPFPSLPSFAESDSLDPGPILVVREPSILRDAPQSAATALATLRPGERVGQTGETVSAEGLEWIPVRQGSRSGWLTAEGGAALARVVTAGVAMVRPVIGADGGSGEFPETWETVVVDQDRVEHVVATERLRLAASAWNLDGSRLVAVDEDAMVVTLDAAGTKAVIGPGTHPRWAPNGDRIAYIAADEHRVLLSDGDGQGLVIHEEFGRVVGLDWSPDGTRIAVLAYTCDPCDDEFMVHILSVAVASGEVTVLTPDYDVGGCGGHSLDWIPDGSAIRFNRFVETGGRYVSAWFQVDVATGDITPVPGGEACAIASSPDGAFTVAALGDGVTAVRADGSAAVLLAPWGDPPEVYEPAWSPDGLEISFRTACDDCFVDTHLLVSVAGGGMTEVRADNHAWRPLLVGIGE